MTLLKYATKYDKDLSNLAKNITDERILSVLTKNGVHILRPIQIEAINKGLFFGKNFLICTPSGSGKTIIGELAIINNVFNDMGKGFYLVPYRALASEKYKYFTKNYKEFGIKVGLSIGDFEDDEDILKQADIIVTTFEKLDSLLRNKPQENHWIKDISTIVVDEIHVMGDIGRGFKLESLIIRLMSMLYDVQMICLSATISNPHNLCSWLNQLSNELSGNQFYLIKSDDRPVKLNYKVQIAHNKDSFIRRKIKECLMEKGQILVFVNTRKACIENAKKFSNLTEKLIDDVSKRKIEECIAELKKIPGNSSELIPLIKCGIAYHNAGLLTEERHVIEDLYGKRHIKVIFCTTTLAAGVNTPARLVILKDFKKRVLLSGNIEWEINNGNQSQNIYELPGVNSGYFIPFSNNQTFQLLGRAGRPGLDLTGEGIILVKNQSELEWVEDFYFSREKNKGEYIPKYNPIISGFNNIGALREQILLISHQESGITMESLINFFKKTYFSYNFGEDIKLENYLLLKNLDVHTLLNLHSDTKKLDNLSSRVTKFEIFKMSSDIVIISIFMNRLFEVKFDIIKGISCSCGFETKIIELNNNQIIRNNYHFCDHIIALLGFLIQKKFKNKFESILRYLNDIVPHALKAERIIDFLIREGFLIMEEKIFEPNINNKATEKSKRHKTQKFYPTPLGSLTTQLYIQPLEMIFLRDIICNTPIYSQMELIDAVCDFLIKQGKYKNEYFSVAIKMWITEEKIQKIIVTSEKITAGDFFSFKDEFIRVIAYFRAVSGFFNYSEVGEMAETLSMRVEYGVKEDLLDLVIRIPGVGRNRGRKLANNGFPGVSDIYNSNPVEIHRKTGFPNRVCEKIYENCKKIKISLLNLD